MKLPCVACRRASNRGCAACRFRRAQLAGLRGRNSVLKFSPNLWNEGAGNSSKARVPLFCTSFGRSATDRREPFFISPMHGLLRGCSRRSRNVPSGTAGGPQFRARARFGAVEAVGTVILLQRSAIARPPLSRLRFQWKSDGIRHHIAGGRRRAAAPRV